MNDTAGFATMAVRIRHSMMEHQNHQQALHVLDIPPRSRLYSLVPCEAESLWRESLTSYINRLAWAHGVSPRKLLVQEILPSISGKPWLHSSPYHVNVFSRRGGAMTLNGTETLAVEVSTCLEHLTARADLPLLTWHGWLGDLPVAQNLRQRPAWCPWCYAGWKAQHSPLYQPLLWMLQVVTMCPRHKRPLHERCPHCQQHQSVIFTDKTSLGECTQCSNWLGIPSLEASKLDEETIRWQEWVIGALEELRLLSLSSGTLCWQTFFTSLASRMKEPGAYSRLARVTGIARESLYNWTGKTIKPVFETLLRFCYICGVTPMQVMTGQDAALKQVIQSGIAVHPPRRPLSYQQVDKQRCLELLQNILDGREEFLCLRQIAERLGYRTQTLMYHFPQECAQIVQQAKARRKQQKEQRIARLCEEVRQAVLTLHAQGIPPSHSNMMKLLSRPGFMRAPEASAVWHATRRELGLET
jgi:DNA-binding phage protein/ribosomal protein S27E